MDREVTQQWSDASTSLLDKVGRALTAAPIDRPQPVFHFTDCDGLIGILTSKTLRASLAASLNDPSEVQYGVTRARELISRDAVTLKVLSSSRVSELLDGSLRWHVYVISFCADTDTGLHWLHYGRSGLGMAIGFDSRLIEKEPFYLFPVLYREGEQDNLIKSIVETIDDSLTESMGQVSTEPERALLGDIAAELAANYLWMAAPRMKAPAFAAEREWRLITYDPVGHGDLKQASRVGETLFRSAGGRVVPYKDLTFERLPALSIVLGYSTPMNEDDVGLGVLMEEELGKRLPVRRSSATVRP